MEQASPITPDKTLFVLRSHHYNAIWVVSELRRYIRGAAKNETMAAYIRKEFFTHLQPHLLEEEMMLFPKLHPNDTLRLQAEDQHARLHSIAENCVSCIRILPSTVEAFADLLEENIRFEERTLFPYLQKVMYKEDELLN